MNANKEIQHLCKENEHDDVEIKYEKINIEQWSWVLDQAWYATPDEVEGGFAKKTGDEIVTHRLLISHCPFCGKKLTNQKGNTW